VRWEGGIPPNPEFDRLIEIAAVAREWQPDLLLAVGGGSTLDGTKFIAAASQLEDPEAAWRIVTHREFPPKVIPIGAVMTLPATGSEWNAGFVTSRRSIGAKLPSGSPLTYPKFSLLDPTYTATLPVRQVRNGIFDAIAHCIDQYLTPTPLPLMDGYFLTTLRELVDIGPALVEPNPDIELRGRLIVAASFALNEVFSLGKETCWAIHMIGHQLTVKYGIDHGATLSIIAPPFLENQFEPRKAILARSAEAVFDVYDATPDEKGRAFIAKLREFIVRIGLPLKVSDWEGAKVAEGDVEEVTRLVITSMHGPFGWRRTITEDVVREVLTKVIL
jgi:alcohol dehydrogenase YqhD (iron-dependent ADH family)